MGARTQGGWKLRLPEGRGRKTYLVRFRFNGERIERSTGESDPHAAAQAAARIYSDVVSGRRVARAAVSSDMASAFASWLADYETTHAEGSAETVTMYVESHLLPFFGSFDRMTEATYGDYIRERIGHVTRSTVRKELSALRMFRAWCQERGIVVPPVPPLPKSGHPGVRHKQARRPVSRALPASIVRRLLLAMPERSRRTGAWTRPAFVALFETGLRPSTLLRLRAGDHYKRGRGRLFVSRDIDKAQYERDIPLSDAARTALDRVTPRHVELDEQGRGPLLFEGLDASSLRDSLEAARVAAGVDGPLSVYDLRHSRASMLANSGAPLAGVARLLGHRRVSTTAIYVTADDDAARAALNAVAPRKTRFGGHSGGHSAKTSRAKEGT